MDEGDHLNMVQNVTKGVVMRHHVMKHRKWNKMR